MADVSVTASQTASAGNGPAADLRASQVAAAANGAKVNEPFGVAHQAASADQSADANTGYLATHRYRY